MTRQEAAVLGGRANVEKNGRAHMVIIGALGGRPRKPKPAAQSQKGRLPALNLAKLSMNKMSELLRDLYPNNFRENV